MASQALELFQHFLPFMHSLASSSRGGVVVGLLAGTGLVRRLGVQSARPQFTVVFRLEGHDGHGGVLFTTGSGDAEVSEQRSAAGAAGDA